MKKSCLYYFDLKLFFGKRLIAIDYGMQNSTDLIIISGIMRDKHPINPLNNLNFDKKDLLVHHTDNNLTNDGNKKKDNNTEDLKSERADLYRQNQKTPCIAPNTRYYNCLYYL